MPHSQFPVAIEIQDHSIETSGLLVLPSQYCRDHHTQREESVPWYSGGILLKTQHTTPTEKN